MSLRTILGKDLRTLTNSILEQELAVLPGNLDILLKDARKTMAALPSMAPGCKDLTHWQIQRLGEKKGDDTARPELTTLLSGRRQPFCIGLEGQSRGNTAFFLGTKDHKGKLTRNLLRSSFGIAQIEKYQPEDDLLLNTWCSCTAVCIDEDALKKQESEGTCEPWTDALAQAATGMDYQVRMYFWPLDSKWLQDQSAALTDHCGQLSLYEKRAFQLSTSDGTNPSEVDNVFGKLRVLLHGESKSTYNQSTSLSEELSRENMDVQLCCEELRFHAKACSQLSRDGGWGMALQVCASNKEDLELLQTILSGVLSKTGYSSQWGTYSTPSTCLMLPGIRLSRLSSYPTKSFPGFKLDEVHNFEVNLPAPKGPYIQMGKMVWNEEEVDNPLQIALTELNRHAFVCGMTGSGKSNTVCSLLVALEQIPFLVIEPVKGDYRSLKKAMPNKVIEVYNMDVSSPRRWASNPFWFPKNGSLQFHIDSLKTIISAAFELSAAMPNILEQCLTSAYINTGWQISASRNVYAGQLPEEKLYPTFSTLCEEVEQYLNRSEYKGEALSTYKGALLTRLQSFTTGSKGMLLNCTNRPKFEEWVHNGTSCVLELDALSDDADKAIIMGTVLSQYFQCAKLRGASDNLRHLIVLEEAHHLFKENITTGDGLNTSRQQLVETLNNVLAEIRSYGEGVIVVDQSPTGVSSQVIKNTAVKIVHRVDFGEDLDILQRALLLEDEDKNAPASLSCGYSLVRFGGIRHPVHARMPLCQSKESSIFDRNEAAVAEAEKMLQDVGGLYSLLQLHNDRLKEFTAQCGKFMNHFLYDDIIGIHYAYNELFTYFFDELHRLGYDKRILTSQFAVRSILYALRTAMEKSLFASFPNQYLLCGKIMLAVDRYLDLATYRSSEIRPGEWKLLTEYIRQVLQPAIREFYKVCKDPNVSAFANKITRSDHALLLAMCQKKWAESKYTQEDIPSFEDRSPQENIQLLLLDQAFLLIPNKKLCKDLWEDFYFKYLLLG